MAYRIQTVPGRRLAELEAKYMGASEPVELKATCDRSSDPVEEGWLRLQDPHSMEPACVGFLALEQVHGHGRLVEGTCIHGCGNLSQELPW